MRIHASLNLILFALGVIFGDILVLIFRPTFLSSFWWLILACLLLVLSIIISRIPTLILAFLAGLIIISNRAAPSFVSSNYFNDLVGQNVTISGKVLKDPEESSGKLNLTLSNLILKDQSRPDFILSLEGKLFTQAQKVDIKRSDIVTVSGSLSAGFGTYAATIFRPEISEIKREEPGDIFLKVRDFFAQGIKNFLPKKQSGLALGYLLGQKTGVDESFQENLRTVGLTHIIVASGAHLGVLVGFARKLFGRISRFASFFFSGLFTLGFVGITGLSASMLRASLVVCFSLLAWYFGRKAQPARIILLVAAVTLIVEPSYLFDLAWLLSFASFSGILIVAPILTRFFYGKNKTPGLLGKTLISSVSATLLCTPILLYFFGSVSLISIFANILILPTISITMGLTFLTGIFALVLPFLAQLISQAALAILNYQISIVEFFGDKKMFQVEIAPENPLVFLLLLPVIAIVIFAYFLERKRRKNQKI